MPEPQKPTPLRILYVEDNDNIRELTLSLLEHEDREIVARKSAEEALEEFQRNRFDVVITDISLPEMSGIDLVKRVIEGAPRTWFVLASGYQLPPEIERLGPHVRAVTKPFESETIDALLAEIRSATVNAAA